MFVGNKKDHFARLVMKKVGVELGTSSQGYFEGVGVMIVSIPRYNNEIFLLYPTFYSSTDKYCTISTGALKSSAGFRSVLLDAHKQLELASKENKSFILPCTVSDDIDFITLHIHQLHPSSNSSSSSSVQKSASKKFMKPYYHHMSLQPASITNRSVVGTSLFSAWLHIVYGHRSLAILQEMINKGYISGPGLPCKLAPLPGRCPICDAARMTRVPKRAIQDHTPLPIGTRFHADFTFFNEESIRGFTAALIIVEATSRYVWTFPCRHKGAPIDLCLYFFNQMRNMGFPCIRCRSDEDGALINSTEFCKLMYRDLGMAMESTGGYESSINGGAESPIRPLKNTLRSMLIGSSLPNPFFCFALQVASLVYNNVLHRTTKKIPSLVLTGKFVPLKKLHPFGAKVKVLTNLPSKRSLTARTSGDPRDNDFDANAITIVDSAQKSSFTGRLVGYGNHTNVILVYKEATATDTHRIIRCHHAEVDHYGLSISTSDQQLPNERMLLALHNQVFDPTAPTKWHQSLEECTLDTVSSPFDPSSCETFTITLPPKGQALGIYVDTDEDYLKPIVGKISKEFKLFDQIPLRHQYYKSWVVQIGDESPITAQGFIDAVHFLQKDNEPRDVEITLSNMNEPVRYHHQTFRAYFDSCTALRYSHMVTLSYEPEAHPSVFKCLDSEIGHEWREALFHQYNKNDAVRLVAQPTPVENVPKDRKVLPVVMSTKVKKKGTDIYQLVTRMCANGSKQQQGIDYEFSYSPTAGVASIRITLCLAAAFGWVICVIDIVNCFQSTMVPPEERLLISMPPLYLKWFRQKYPNVKLEESKSGKYVLEALNGIQGDKSIGRKWFTLVKRLLEQFGFKMCLVEPSLFVYQKEDGIMILNTSTDDFLCTHNSDYLYDRLCTRFRQLFEITTKGGNQFTYLNLSIIQSKYGVSYDQTDHIRRKIINKYFPPEKVKDSPMKPVHTPFRTDSEYEKELMEQLPATKEELKRLEEEYGGSYPEILGDIMHVECWSRPELSYSLRRLGAYTHAPNQAAFAGLKRALRFIATHPHRPIFYPRRDITGFEELRVDFDHPNFKSMDLPVGLCTMSDADHARDNVTRRSCENSVSLLNGVLISQKMNQQRATALHSTHSEIVAAKSGTKQSIYLQDICTFLQLKNELIRPVPTFLDSQPCIDSLEANTVTTRVKHIAVQISWVHEQIAAERIKLNKVDTNLNLADSGTKPNPSPVFFRQYDYIIGVRFYPPPESEHYQLLELHKFISSPYSTDKQTPTDNKIKDDPICSESTSQDPV